MVTMSALKDEGGRGVGDGEYFEDNEEGGHSHVC